MGSFFALPFDKNETATISPMIAPTIPPISLKKPTMQPAGLAFSLTPHFGHASAFELISFPHSLHLTKATEIPPHS